MQIAAAIDVSTLSAHPPGSRFPNVVAIGAPGGKKIVSVYSDHSLYAWDVQDIKRVSSVQCIQDRQSENRSLMLHFVHDPFRSACLIRGFGTLVAFGM